MPDIDRHAMACNTLHVIHGEDVVDARLYMNQISLA